MKVSIDTSSLRSCAFKRCVRQPVYRHHKGCDNYIGRYDLETAHHYKEYLDCVVVCDYHHMCIHAMYLPLFNTWHALTPMNMRTPARALRLRAQLIAYCDKIVSGQIRLKKPSKKFKRKWLTRRKLWLAMIHHRSPSKNPEKS